MPDQPAGLLPPFCRPIPVLLACVLTAGCAGAGPGSRSYSNPYRIEATSAPDTLRAQSLQTAAPEPEGHEGDPHYAALDAASFFFESWQSGDAKLVASTVSREYSESLGLNRRTLLDRLESAMAVHGELQSFELAHFYAENDDQARIGYRLTFVPSSTPEAGELTLVRENGAWRVVPPAALLPR